MWCVRYSSVTAGTPSCVLAFLVCFRMPCRQAWKRKKDVWLRSAPLSHVATVLRISHSVHGPHSALILLHMHPVNSQVCTTGVPHSKETTDTWCTPSNPWKSLTFTETKNCHMIKNAIYKQQTPVCT